MYVLKRATRKDETAFDIGRDRVRVPANEDVVDEDVIGGGPGEVTEAQRARGGEQGGRSARRAALKPKKASPCPAPAASFVAARPRLRAGVALRPGRRGKNARRVPRGLPARPSPESLPSRDAGTFVLLWVQSAQRAGNESLSLLRREPCDAQALVAVARDGRVPVGQRTSPRVHVRRVVRDAFNLGNAKKHTAAGFRRRPGRVISAASANASEVVVDGGYTRVLREWRRAARAACAVGGWKRGGRARVRPEREHTQLEKTPALRARSGRGWRRWQRRAGADVPLAPETQARAATKDARRGRGRAAAGAGDAGRRPVVANVRNRFRSLLPLHPGGRAPGRAGRGVPERAGGGPLRCRASSTTRRRADAPEAGDVPGPRLTGTRPPNDPGLS